ncbi:MAG: helix-turn-helix domain-containing protein, partial [Granulosicoccaceae bacterium]
MNIDKLHRNQQKVLHVMSQLWAHRNHAISLEQSAAWANTSPAHFHRLYKAVTGETVFKTHQRMRMSQARSELMHRDWPVSRIAQRLGFSGPESFVRAFARHTGTTPGQWRLDATTPLTRSDKDKLMHKVELIELPAMHGLLLPHRGDYLLIGERFGFFATWAAQQAPELVENISWGLYYDDPDSRPKSELRSAVFCP